MKREVLSTTKPASFDSEEERLTLYYPTEGFDSAEQQVRIKSYLYRVWKKNLAGKESKQELHRFWHEGVEPILESEYGIGKGVLILAKVVSSTVESFELKKLPQKPIQRSYWGKIYDMAQYQWMLTNEISALILSVSEKGCEIYLLKSGEWIENKEIEKQPILYSHKHSFGRYAPSRGEGTYYSWGFDKQERREKTEKTWFINEVAEILKKQKRKFGELKQILVYHSEEFREQLQSLEESLKTIFPGVSLQLAAETHRTEANLKASVQAKILQAQALKVKEEVAGVWENYHLTSRGWYEVAEAVRQRRIEKLIISPSGGKEGYVGAQGEVFTYPVKNSKQVSDLAPWMTRAVLENNGKVILAERESWLKGNEIVAKVWY